MNSENRQSMGSPGLGLDLERGNHHQNCFPLRDTALSPCFICINVGLFSTECVLCGRQ